MNALNIKCTQRTYPGCGCKGYHFDQPLPKAKNLCAKMRPKSDPYETWQAGSWTWQVLKKWQADDAKPYARWFCNVITPMCPDGEMGDVYVSEIKKSARRIK